MQRTHAWRRWGVCVVLALSFVSVQLGAKEERPQAAASPFTAEEFSARRAKVYKALGDDFAILTGVDAPEDYRRPRQHNNFYYVSGVERPGATLLLDGRSHETTIFLDSNSDADEVRKASGIERVLRTDQFVETVRAVAKDRKRVFLPLWPGEGNAQGRDSMRSARSKSPPLPGDRRVHRIKDFRDGILELTGPLEIVDLENVIDPLRRVKSAAEIAVMREAARIGAEGIADTIRATRPGILERELEGIFELAALRNGAHASAWTPIVATGPNITEFHYFHNNRRIEAGDMILVDAGPDYNYYCSDLTRVWPCTGPYPPRYRELYDKLLEVHKTTIAAVRPGATLDDLLRIMAEKSRELGIGPHVLRVAGHYTGMAPHDVGDYREPFVPGVVFNVEPLLLIRQERLHIRFEDTILCTANGPEVLTPLDVLPWEADKLLEMRDSKSRTSRR